MAAWRGHQLLMGMLAAVLSACATTPGGPPGGPRTGAPVEAEASLRETVGPVQPPPAGGRVSAVDVRSPLRDALRRNQEEALRLEREGHLRDALERWKIVLTIEPGYAEAKQKQTALEAMIQDRVRKHLAAGKERVQRREKQAAEREFLAALRLDPLNREALEHLYLSEEQLGEQTAFARPLLPPKSASQPKADHGRPPETKPPPPEETMEREDTGEEVSFAEAAEIFRRGDYLEAIDAFDRVLVQQPGMREAVEYQKLAYYNQGVAYVSGENYAEALRMFEQVKKMQPDFKRVAYYTQTTREKLAEQHNLLGIRHFREKKLKEAIEEWDQALALNPRLESARRSRERAVRLLKNLEEVK